MSRRLTATLALSAAFAAAAPASASAASVVGKWKGTVSITKGGTGSFPVVMKITGLRAGERSGRVLNPGSPCKGAIVYKGRKGPKYLFQYLETSGSSKCTGDDRITVSVVGGLLRWKGVSPAGIVGKGTLQPA